MLGCTRLGVPGVAAPGGKEKQAKTVLQIWHSGPRYLQLIVIFCSLGKHPQRQQQLKTQMLQPFWLQTQIWVLYGAP